LSATYELPGKKIASLCGLWKIFCAVIPYWDCCIKFSCCGAQGIGAGRAGGIQMTLPTAFTGAKISEGPDKLQRPLPLF